MPWESRGGEWCWVEPELSLGWQAIDWIEETLSVPSGPYFGDRLVLTGWQARFVADWLALNPALVERWRPGQPTPWLYRRALVRLSKKMGKSPLAAALTILDAFGPSQFDGLDAAGEPVGRPREAPWHQIAAVSEDQTGNTYSPLYTMLSESELSAELGLDVGLQRTHRRGHSQAKIEVVTASAGSRTGQPITGATLEEVQLWTPSNGGRKLHATIRNNLSPTGGRILAVCNAPEPGRRSVAEAIERAAETRPDILIYGPQYARDVADLEDHPQLLEALRWIYRDAPWTQPDRILADVTDPDVEPDEVRRDFLNVPSAAESALGADAVADVEELEPGAWLAVGFDGSRSRDATALVAVNMESGVAHLLGYWERDPGRPKRDRWEVPRHEVLAVFERLFDRYRVVRLKADPSKWHDELASLQNRHNPAGGAKVIDRMPVWQDSVVDRAIQGTQDAFRGGTLRLAAGQESEVLRAHVARARVLTRLAGSRRIRSLAKPDDGPESAEARIDAAAALVYAQQARLEALEAGWEPTQPSEAFVLWG